MANGIDAGSMMSDKGNKYYKRKAAVKARGYANSAKDISKETKADINKAAAKLYEESK